MMISSAVALLLAVALSVTDAQMTNPCCSFPCMNRGVCMLKATAAEITYMCDCSNTGFTGQNCDQPEFNTWVQGIFMPDPSEFQKSLIKDDLQWEMNNNNPEIKKLYMRGMYKESAKNFENPPRFSSDASYLTMESYYNSSRIPRILPAVPSSCPTPMGMAGRPNLPDADNLVQKLFARRQYVPDSRNTNVLFTSFSEHLHYGLFNNHKAAGQSRPAGMDAAHIYGPDKRWRDALRSFTNGKLRMRVVNGEEWPLSEAQTGVPMRYVSGTTADDRFALGHEDFGLNPHHIMMGTVWMREHNRVCDVLKDAHPEWNDEQLYQTARLIVTAEIMKMAIEEYTKYMYQTKFQPKFDPSVMYDQQWQYQNHKVMELDFLPDVISGLKPDMFYIEQDTYRANDWRYNSSIVPNYGLYKLVNSAVSQKAAKFGSRNYPSENTNTLIQIIRQARDARVPSFNAYRKQFRMKPYVSFLDMVGGDNELANDLEDLYGDVDGVEFITGMLVEGHLDGGLIAPTLAEISGSYIFKSMMASPLASPLWWRSSTFGGDAGLNVIKDATVEKLFCQNMKNCPKIGFTVPNQQ
uniref:prostaglandin-endoperoxide synthase n=1 Tax=Aspidosiphon laevis TaxID=210791 RepID=A0A0U2K608_9ANNE|nr:cyclooxygenase a-like protein [Aspidosiphon laevis]